MPQMEAEEAGGVAPGVVPPRPHEQEARPRQTNVTTGAIEKYGFTDGCSGWRAVRLNRTNLPHNEACRRRLEEEMAKESEEARRRIEDRRRRRSEA